MTSSHRRNKVIDFDVVRSEPDGIVIPDAPRFNGNTALVGTDETYGARLRTLPDNNVGGSPGAFNRLGWTQHPFAQTYRTQPFRGGHVKAPVAQLNTGGEVGFSTRSTRLAKRLSIAYADMVPSERTVAAEVMNS